MDPFTAKLLLSFLVGGIWVTIITICADRYGTKLGGFIGGLPSTVLVSLLFIGVVQGINAAVEATNVVSLAQGISGLYMVIYSYLSRKNFWLGLVTSMVSWLGLNSLIVLTGFNNFATSVIGFLLLLVFCYYSLEKWMETKQFKTMKTKYTKLQLLGRGIFSGLMISVAVLASKLGGPVYGGIFSAFPAVFTSTLIILYYSKGVEFTRTFSKTFTISGLVNVVTYAIAVRYTYPTLGILWGTILSTFVALILSYFVLKFIQKNMT